MFKLKIMSMLAVIYFTPDQLDELSIKFIEEYVFNHDEFVFKCRCLWILLYHIYYIVKLRMLLFYDVCIENVSCNFLKWAFCFYALKYGYPHTIFEVTFALEFIFAV